MDLIIGIKHYNAHPVNVTLIDKNLPSKVVTVQLEAEIGEEIDSRFAFYGH